MKYTPIHSPIRFVCPECGREARGRALSVEVVGWGDNRLCPVVLIHSVPQGCGNKSLHLVPYEIAESLALDFTDPENP